VIEVSQLLVVVEIFGIERDRMMEWLVDPTIADYDYSNPDLERSGNGIELTCTRSRSTSWTDAPLGLGGSSPLRPSGGLRRRPPVATH
jgi:hypothetical protein